MNDIENRLRADARGIESPPDFDRALRSAMVAHRPRPKAWLAAAAAVLLVGGGAAALAWPQNGTSQRNAGDATGGDPVLGALTSPHSDSPAQLMIVFKREVAPSGDCYSFNVNLVESAGAVHITSVTRADVAAETKGGAQPGAGTPRASVIAKFPVSGVSSPPTAVRLGSRTPAILIKGTGSAIPTVTPSKPSTATPTCPAGWLAAIVPALKKPLGSRPIIDDTTGQAIPVFSTPPPVPGYLPRGYHATAPENETDPMSAAALESGPGLIGPLTLNRFFRADRMSALTVTAAPSAAIGPGATVLDRTTVSGHPAIVTESTRYRCVTWTADTGIGLQVCSGAQINNVDPVPPTPPAQRLSEAELLKVADSLR